MTAIKEVWKRFSAMHITASIILFLTALAAAVIANSPAGPAYQEFLSHELHFRIGDFNLFSHGGEPLTFLQFINDGLMTVFFLSVGLEIKRELLVGELSSFRKAVLPFIAACGGMVLPVAVYSLICPPGTEGAQGLAIPMATDIAFSLGVLSLFGSRVPLCLKIFLTAFAVVDDIGGILVIALFYSSHVAYGYLLVAAVLYLILFIVGKFMTTNKLFFMILGVAIWYLFLQSGVHSTIAGVLLAFAVPARPQLNVHKYLERMKLILNTFPEETAKDGDIVLSNRQIARLKLLESASDRVISPLQSLEDNLHGVVGYLILPMFAFVNAGVIFAGGGDIVGNVSVAIASGLLLGKFLGIFSFTWLAVKSGITSMPRGMNWKNIAGVSLLGGIGFTVSLFITNLSFGGNDPELLNQAKFGVLAGTIISGLLGMIVLSRVLPKHDKKLTNR